VARLVSFGTRHSLSGNAGAQRGITAASTWVESELRRYSQESGGRLQVQRDPFVAPAGPRVPVATQMSNVLAVLPGTSDPDRLYVVSAHLDSCVCAQDPLDATSDAPGADDDASGVAAVLELARVMSRQRFAATLVFALVVGEEQGLLGSTHLAERYRQRGVAVAGMISNDIVGSSAGGPVVRLFSEGVPSNESPEQARIRRAIGGENDAPSRQLARYLASIAERHVPGIEVRLVYRRDRYSRGGDHIPFAERGYPAVRFTEMRENYQHQHQRVRREGGVQYGDLAQEVDPSYVAAVARVNAAGLAALASAPAAPRGVTIDSAPSNDTALRWQAVPGAESYRIVWRDTTAARWQEERDVGPATSATLSGLSKDDHVFAVQAVGRDGHASLPVIPEPRQLRVPGATR
jgi:hypothetical protein